MDCEKIGLVITKGRKEKGMTQKELAQLLHVSDKTVSKWERGMGCPDVSLLSSLSDALGVTLQDILSGDLSPNDLVGGNMKEVNYFVCPSCGNLTVCTGEATISCCGRKLEALKPQNAPEAKKLKVELVEDDWYITSDHPMQKEHSIAFVAFATGDRLQIVKQYPEWDLQTRIPQRGHGILLWYCNCHGLFYQLI